MGLDLICDDYSKRFGSYSYVHVVRKDWVSGSIQYLKEWLKSYEKKKDDSSSGDETSSDDETSYNENDIYYAEMYSADDCRVLINHLESWCKGDIFCPIYYPAVTDLRLDLLRAFGLNGLYLFVNHPDSNGYFTSNESRDILEALSIIYPYLDKSNFDNEDKSVESYFLYPIFKKSVDSGKLIIFA